MKELNHKILERLGPARRVGPDATGMRQSKRDCAWSSTELLLKHWKQLDSIPISQLYSGSDADSNIDTRENSYYLREREIDSIMSELSFLSLAVEQRLKGLEIAQSSYFFPTQNLSSEFPGLHRAAGCVLSDFFDLIYGENWSIKTSEPLPLVVFSEGGYCVHTGIRVAVIPISDKDRIRFWVGLGHEAFHEKVEKIFDNPALVASKKKETANKKLDRLLNDVPESEWKFIKDTLEDMINDISGIYMQSSRPISETIDKIGTRLFLSQVEEIFCDIGSTILSGPADFLASSSQWVLRYRSSQYGIFKHLDEFNHPPEYVRLKYMLEVLKGLDYPQEDIKTWAYRLEEIRCEEELLSLKSDTFDQKRIAERISTIYDNYTRIICGYYLDKIATILNWTIIQRDFYTGIDGELLKINIGSLWRMGVFQLPQILSI
jgi:hypothetical protein